MNIKEFFENYKKNTVYFEEIDRKLLNLSNKEEWFDLIADRAISQSQLFLENKNAINEYKNFISSHGEGGHYTKEEAEALFDGVLGLYLDDMDDYEIMVQAIDPLIEFYKRERDFSALVKLLAIKSYEKVEYSSKHFEALPGDFLLSDALKAISYKAYFPDLDIEAKRRIFACYYNIVNANLKRTEYSISLSHYLLTEALNFWASPLLTDEDRADRRISDLIGRMKESWLFNIDKIGNAPQATKDFYIKNSDELYYRNLETMGTIYDIRHEIVVSHFESLLLKGQISPEEGLRDFSGYYMKRKEVLEKKVIATSNRFIDMPYEYLNYLYFFINAPAAAISWVDSNKISREFAKPYMEVFLEDIHEKWDELYQGLSSTYLDNCIMDICISLLPYSGTTKKQGQWLKRLLLKRHLPTFIHSNMVATLAATFAEDIIENEADLLVCDEWPLSRISENKNELLEFINEASLYHDIGKAKIGGIISIQSRPISDYEFSLIKNHTSFGYQFAENVSFLEQYKDVIIGHHKFYDGLGGYPDSFDNTKSPIKPIVDLITICDCLEAATDFLSRNYNPSKTLEEVTKEIYEGRSTRYNPGMANYLARNKKLQEKLGYILGEGRIQKYYDIYEEYLAH